MAETWLTSDMHFGHERISQLAGRPFSSVDDMNEHLVTRWNQNVGRDDTVYVLGDTHMGKIADSLPIAKELNGRKILVPGNHDRVWRGNDNKPQKQELWEREYADAGYEVSHTPPSIKTEVGKISTNHFPISGDSQGLDRHAEHRPSDTGQLLAHGHVHDSWRQRGRQVNVGVDAWGGEPVHLSTVVDLMKRPTQNLDPVKWRR